MEKTNNNLPNADTIKRRARIPRNKKYYWVFFVLSLAFLVLGVALLPTWREADVFWNSLGTKYFNLIFFFIVILYIIGYLMRQIIRERKVAIKILTVFEAGFFFAVALGSIMQHFQDAVIGGTAAIVGIAFWSRGFVYIVKAYLCKHDEIDKYPLWMLILSIGLVSLGSVMIANRMFTPTLVIWIVSCLLILLAGVFLTFGFVSKPEVDKAMKAYKKEQKKLKKQEKELAKQEKAVAKAQKKAEKLESKVEKSSPALLPEAEKTE